MIERKGDDCMYFNFKNKGDQLYEVKQYNFHFKDENIAFIFVHDYLDGTYGFEIRFTDGRIPVAQQTIVSSDAILSHIPDRFNSLHETLQGAIDEATARAGKFIKE